MMARATVVRGRTNSRNYFDPLVLGLEPQKIAAPTEANATPVRLLQFYDQHLVPGGPLNA